MCHLHLEQQDTSVPFQETMNHEIMHRDLTMDPTKSTSIIHNVLLFYYFINISIVNRYIYVSLILVN